MIEAAAALISFLSVTRKQSEIFSCDMLNLSIAPPVYTKMNLLSSVASMPSGIVLVRASKSLCGM